MYLNKFLFVLKDRARFFVLLDEKGKKGTIVKLKRKIHWMTASKLVKASDNHNSRGYLGTQIFTPHGENVYEHFRLFFLLEKWCSVNTKCCVGQRFRATISWNMIWWWKNDWIYHTELGCCSEHDANSFLNCLLCLKWNIVEKPDSENLITEQRQFRIPIFSSCRGKLLGPSNKRCPG